MMVNSRFESLGARRRSPLSASLVLLVLMSCLVRESMAQEVVGIYREFFGDTPTGEVSGMTNSAIYPNNPTEVSILDEFFEAPAEYADYYGQRLRAILVAPETGSYTFYICSDDQSFLYLSPTEDPASKYFIAAEPAWNGSRDYTSTTRRTGATAFFPTMDPALPANRSDYAFGTINLTAGQRCYIEVLHKEGGGGDNVSLAWMRPGGFEGPIPASHFRVVGLTLPQPPVLTAQPASVTVTEREGAQFTAAGTSLKALNYQWQVGQVNIAGANQSTYVIYETALSQNQKKYRCILYNDLGTNTTAEATLTVLPDQVKPTLAGAANESNNRVLVVFSEPVGAATALATGNYAVSGGVTVSGASFFNGDPRAVALTTSALVIGNSYTVTVSGVRDTANSPNTILPGSQVSFVASNFTPWSVGDANQSGSVMLQPGGYDLTMTSSGISGGADQFLFNFQQRTGDFDLSARVDSVGNSDPWARGGLMARGTLSTNSLFAGVFGTPSISGLVFSSRAVDGANAVTSGSFPANYPYTWVRLKRVGNVFTGYASYDNATWYGVGSAIVTAPPTLFVGMAASSHNPSESSTARFREVVNVTGGVVSTIAPAFETVGPSSRRTGLIFSEIMYRPAPRTDGRVLEFVELMNTTPFPQDLGGFQLAGTIDYVFPGGTSLAPGQYLLVAANVTDVAAVYGISGVHGPYGGSLDTGSRQLRLINDLGAVLLSVNFSSQLPWPVAADGAGHSLVLRNPSYGENQSPAWAPSDHFGGSPGRQDGERFDAVRNVVINEFLAHTDDPELDYIELYNHGNTQVNLSGMVLTDNASTNKYVLPPNTLIGPGGFRYWNQNQLGFSLSAAGESIYLIDPAGQRVVDAVRFEGQENGTSTGRVPDGAKAFYRLAGKTPGAANGARRQDPIVINEIMYHPISEDENDSYVELYNRSGSPVNVGGWRFVDGIGGVLPSNTIIGANSFLVVAENASRLITNYPNLNSGNTIGNFSGSLSRSGERVALAMPDTVVSTNNLGLVVTNTIQITMAEVSYSDGGRWGQWSDGGGSSLELRDPNADARLAANWADSDESAKAGWTLIEHTGVLDNGLLNGNFPEVDRLHIMLLGSGECQLDDVEVVDSNSTSLLSNGGFDSGLFDWAPQGTHDPSFIESGGGYTSPASLHVVATGRGDTGANRISTPLLAPLAVGSTATIRARVRWLRGHPEILLRTRGNHLEAYGPLTVPRNLGTPGAVNSRKVANAGPALYEVAHTPVLPAPNQNVVVTARVHDRDGISSLQMIYRLDPATTTSTVLMRDDGTLGDALSGDGIFSATIPGQTAGQMVAFQVRAMDGQGVETRFPSDAPVRECLVSFGEPAPYGNFPAYRLWITAATEQAWRTRERNSNKPLDGTFVYGNSRAVYNVGTLYSGSPWHTPGYNGPLANQCDYVVVFPEDDQFLGTTDFVLATVGNLGSDDSAQREQMAYWIASKLGVYNNYRRYFHMYVNGQKRGVIFEDSQQPSSDLIDEWFPGQTGGDLHKIEDWFEFDDSGDNRFSNVDATLQNFTTTGGVKKLARYRWNWRKRAVKDSANEYADLFRLVDAINAPTDEELARQLPTVMDVDQWLRVFTVEHIVGNWDSYGYNRGKNMYAYKPPGGRWELLLWDIDFVLGSGSDGPNTSMFNTSAPMISRMFYHPGFQRLYWQSMMDAVDGPLAPENSGPYLDAKYVGLAANGLGVADGSATKSYIADRRAYIQQQIASADAAFSITSNGGADFSTSNNLLQLEGTAPLALGTLEVNGITFPVVWTTPTSWRVSISLAPGVNAIALLGRDRSGNALPGAAAAINVTYTGPTDPMTGNVVINEIMYNPVVPNSSYIELYNRSSTIAFDLGGFRLNGVGLVFPGGTLIPPGGYVVIAKNATLVAETYGLSVPVIAEFPGSLDNGGETISLIQPGATPAQDVVIDTVYYDSSLPWPLIADGLGSSLQLKDSSRDNNRVGNWGGEPSNGPYTPGAPNSTLTSLPAFPLVWINEIQPNNVTGATDNVGDRDPWLELYNSGSTPVALAGLSLSDNYTNLTRWVFPTGASISPGQWLVVWLDGEPGETVAGQYHTSFRIANSAMGGVALTRVVGGKPVVIDYLNFQNASADRAFGRFPDGQQFEWGGFYFATPGGANNNLFPVVNVLVNEWMAKNNSTIPNPLGGQFDDWFELYNAGGTTVDLSGYFLSDTLTDPARWEIPQGTTIPANGFLMVWADNNNTLDTVPLHTNFKLSDTGESIGLYAPDQSVVDVLSFGAQASDLSQGRYADGAAAPYLFLTTATPGAPNIYNPPFFLPGGVVRQPNGWTTIQFGSEANRAYRIHYKNDLNDPAWTLLGQVVGNGSTKTVEDQTSAAAPNRFYIIELIP